MATLSANKLIIAVQVIVVCATTLLALEVTRGLFGRPFLWLFGLALLCLAGVALFRIRK